jgi:hypothetical protein
VEAARALLVHKDPTIRRWACHELEKLGDESALRTLIAVSCRDPHPSVRDAAVRAATTFGNDDIAIPLVRALGSEHLGIVANAGRALGVLGDVRVVGYVIKRIVSHGSSPGAWFASETQQAYIRDFDVEVAQTSFIADPIIGTIQEGTVSDVKVLDVTMEWTIVEPILIHTFNRLAHASAKNVDDVKAWVKHGPTSRLLLEARLAALWRPAPAAPPSPRAARPRRRPPPPTSGPSGPGCLALIAGPAWPEGPKVSDTVSSASSPGAPPTWEVVPRPRAPRVCSKRVSDTFGYFTADKRVLERQDGQRGRHDEAGLHVAVHAHGVGRRRSRPGALLREVERPRAEGLLASAALSRIDRRTP